MLTTPYKPYLVKWNTRPGEPFVLGVETVFAGDAEEAIERARAEVKSRAFLDFNTHAVVIKEVVEMKR